MVLELVGGVGVVVLELVGDGVGVVMVVVGLVLGWGWCVSFGGVEIFFCSKRNRHIERSIQNDPQYRAQNIRLADECKSHRGQLGRDNFSYQLGIPCD